MATLPVDLPADQPAGPPQPSILLGMLHEARAVTELPRLLKQWSQLRALPRGAGEPVIVIPGFATGDATTALLREYLDRQGYIVSGWGLGINRATLSKDVPPMIALAEQLLRTSGRQVRLIGWSFGGVVARAVARQRPDLVARVITLGTPLIAPARNSVFNRMYRHLGHDLDAMAAHTAKRHAIPIHVPITAFYSRNDNVVAWPSCIDRVNPQVEHIEVAASHIGMGISPDVFRMIAERLS